MYTVEGREAGRDHKGGRDMAYKHVSVRWEDHRLQVVEFCEFIEK